MTPANTSPLESAVLRPIRDAFGEELVKLAEENPRLVALTADLAEAVRLNRFAELYPDRFIQMGICENDMMGTAAGLALGGMIPVATTFAVFATSLANQPVRLSAAYNRTNMKIVASHGGVTVGPDGATHQSFEDVGLMRLLPGMMVVVPGDAVEMAKALRAVVEYDGPVYMRIGRIPTPVVTQPETPFQLGRGVFLKEGTDVAILTTGSMVAVGLAAAEAMEKESIHACVLHLPTVKPLDEEAVMDAAARCSRVVTVEEHSIIGGLGGAVAELLSERLPTPLRRVGVKDTFGESGEPGEILEKYGMTPSDVMEAIRFLVNN